MGSDAWVRYLVGWTGIWTAVILFVMSVVGGNVSVNGKKLDELMRLIESAEVVEITMVEKAKGLECECGFVFSGPGEYRNCEAFITDQGKEGVLCPDCGNEYVSDGGKWFAIVEKG
jgi:hypothetical protein